MSKPLFTAAFTFILALLLSGCKAFMHGYTWSKAQNAYYLVTGNKDNFGDKRIAYNKGFHRGSALSNFLNGTCCDRGRPSFIYEYQSEAKCRGIRLYYVQLDSVFVFEEPQKGKLASRLIAARRMDDYERQTYERLRSGN